MWTVPCGDSPLRAWRHRLQVAAVQQPLGDLLAPVVPTHLRDGGSDVIRGAPKLQLAVVASDRPSGPRVAVERHADAAGIDEVGVVRPRAPELDMAMTEDHLPFLHAGEQPNVVVAGLRRKAVDVRERRAVA